MNSKREEICVLLLCELHLDMVGTRSALPPHTTPFHYPSFVPTPFASSCHHITVPAVAVLLFPLTPLSPSLCDIPVPSTDGLLQHLPQLFSAVCPKVSPLAHFHYLTSLLSHFAVLCNWECSWAGKWHKLFSCGLQKQLYSGVRKVQKSIWSCLQLEN